jgi:hypothetical protein
VKRHLLSLAAVSLALASSLRAEDFEFDVPVQLSKLDSAFTQGKVSCEVRGLSRDAATGQATGSHGLVGSGASTFPISRGSYDGTVSVRFNANRPISQPTDGRKYVCSLSLIAGSNSGSLCSIDVVTLMQTGRAGQPWMKLVPESIKGCAVGNLPGVPAGGGS